MLGSIGGASSTLAMVVNNLLDLGSAHGEGDDEPHSSRKPQRMLPGTVTAERMYIQRAVCVQVVQ